MKRHVRRQDSGAVPAKSAKSVNHSFLRSMALPVLTFAMALNPDARAGTAAKKVNEPIASAATTRNSSGRAPADEPAAPKRIDLNGGSTIRLNYGAPEWNTSSTKIDAGTLLMREGVTGKTVQINLDETAPDSSIFSGLYSINWQNIERLQVEFYVPPQELVHTKDGMVKILSMINSHELKRHPFILRKTAATAQTVEIYDTKEQARAALRAFRAEQQATAVQNQNEGFQAKKFPSDADLDLERLALNYKDREAGAKAQSERVRIQQIDSHRIEDVAGHFRALSAAEQAKQQADATQLATEAMADYRAGNYKDAQVKFEKSLVLDPLNRVYYFQFGVTLYKNEQFNRAIVFLNLAGANSSGAGSQPEPDADGVNTTERNYYLGLCFFRLKEYANARPAFEKVIATKHAEMAPSSRFYEGVISYELQKWSDAKTLFQAVLDSSKDPTLDKRAEAYIDQITRIQQFEAERARKWLITATIGEMFDTNILLTAITSPDQGHATNVEGYRSLLAASFRYRPVYEETREFAAQVDVLTMSSSNTALKYDQNLRNADPTIVTLTTPWTHKGILWGKGHKFDLVPGYETTWMSIDNDRQKAILHSYFLNLNNLLVVNDNWYTTYSLELRRDLANLDASTGDNDSSAYKFKFDFNSLSFVNDAKTNMLIGDAAMTINSAQGRNEMYLRYDLYASYIQPFYWASTASAKLSYYLLNYPQKTTVQTDNNIGLSFGLSKPINEKYSIGLLSTYNVNGSTDSASRYNKFTALLTFSSTHAF